ASTVRRSWRASSWWKRACPGRPSLRACANAGLARSSMTSSRKSWRASEGAGVFAEGAARFHGEGRGLGEDATMLTSEADAGSWILDVSCGLVGHVASAQTIDDREGHIHTR